MRTFALLPVGVCCFLHSPALFAQLKDPYRAIQIHHLRNGLPVYFLRQHGIGQVRVTLRAARGWNAEKAGEIGAAHTLEHMLVAGAVPAPDGLAGLAYTGLTDAEGSAYFADAEPAMAPQLLRRIASGLRPRFLSNASLEIAKQEIQIEVRRHPKGGRNPDAYLVPEFGLSLLSPSLQDEVEGVQHLSRNDVQAFFDRNYRAENLAVLVVGDFDPVAVLAAAQRELGDYPTGAGVQSWKITPRAQPYRFQSPREKSDSLSYIEIGTKYWALSAEDEIALEVYMDFLLVELPRILREKGNPLYTVAPVFHRLPGGCGTAAIGFDTLPETFAAHRDLLNGLIDGTALGTMMHDQDIARGRDVFEWRFRNGGGSLYSLQTRLDQFLNFRKAHGNREDPFEVYRRLDNHELRRRIRRLFDPSRRFTLLYPPALVPLAPPPVSRFLSLFLLLADLLAIAGAALLCRRLFLRPFNPRHVRYLRKVRYSWATIAFGGIVFCSGLYGWDWVCERFQGMEPIVSFAGALAVFSYLSYWPRTLLLCGEKLTVKSLSYYSRSFPLSEIGEISVCPFFRAVRPRFFRLRFVHFGLWRRGLCLRLKDGTGYYLGFRDPEKVAEELRSYVRLMGLSDFCLRDLRPPSPERNASHWRGGAVG